MAVGVYKAGADDPLIYGAVGMAYRQDGAVRGNIYIAVFYGIIGKGVNCAGRVSHRESF